MADVLVEAVSKSYPAPFGLRSLLRLPPPRQALESVSFDIRPGEVVALIGPNGAGKSSLLRILAGLLLPSSGRARVAGLDVVKDRPASRQAVGAALSEDRGFSLRLSARENLAFFGALYGLTSSEQRARITELTARFESSELLDRPMRTLSTGEKARLVLVRALLHRPKVLLMDELTRSLDPGAALRMRTQLLEEVRNTGAAALFASHDLPEVEALAQRVVLLARGKVAAFGSYATVKAAADDVFARGARP